MKLILTCEHAVATVPEPYVELFAGAPHILETHRGYDIGALEVSSRLEKLAERSFYGRCSRLLIDLNRSLHHPQLFSSFSKHLPSAEQERIVANWYTPFRSAVLQAIEQTISRHGEALHLSVHSFTPELNGEVRSNDIGILYDPSRRREKELARRLVTAIQKLQPKLSVRMNSPFRGTSDGHTSALRRCFNQESYLGIELEINQCLLEDVRGWDAVGQLLLDVLPKIDIGKL